MAAIPQDLLDRIRTLERTVRELAGRGQTRPALDQIQHGQVVIAEGGTLTVQDGDGTKVLHIGGVQPNHTDGTPQYGMLVRREDGTLALSMWTGGPEPQGIDIWDSRGKVIFSEDRVAGGLARPYLSTPLYPTNNLDQYGWTDSSTPYELWAGSHVRHHPKLFVSGYLQADAGTVGACQVYINDDPWGDVHQTNGGWDYWSDGAKPCPGNYMQYVDISIRAWRVSGTGRVRVCPDAAIGQQS
ncbi:hypothetical protein [Streptomyces sp. NRRL B-24484]|uniref:hypothetical protein n=1 Tax=Streptomyces sp. NRRL B-24484 TaxID=1463833 RepID=UPI000693DF88|nr:hypothetical protein [Streptomyces sp. NRRL B-24484]